MADFDIQRGSVTVAISSATATITAGVDYTAPASLGSSFIRIVGVSGDPLGDSDSDFNGRSARNRTYINNPSNLLTSITFEREDGGASAGTCELFYEIIEYIGSGGGDHEIIVRHEEVISYTSSEPTTLDSSTFGSVSTAADVVVFLTGNSSSGNARSDGGEGRWTWEYISGSTLARGTRDVSSGFAGEVSIAVVEFTGSAWTVQRIEHTFSLAATTETETITSVGSLSRAFTNSQSRYSTTSNGADGKGFLAYLSATTTMSYYAAVIDSGQVIVTWVISNSQTTTGAMDVERITGSRADNAGGGTDPDSWTESHSTGSALAELSIWGETAESDKTADQYLVNIGFEVASTTVINLKRGRDEGDRDYRFEVVSWPEVIAAGGNPKGPLGHPLFGPLRGPI